MKLKELMEILSKLDGDLEVYSRGAGVGAEAEITCSYIDKIETGKMDGGYFIKESNEKHDAVRFS